MVSVDCRYFGTRPAISGICCLVGALADCGSCSDSRREELVAAFEARKRAAFSRTESGPDEGDFTRLLEYAINRTVAGGEDVAENDLISDRLGFCRSCEHLKGTNCLKCGCQFVGKLVKKGASCPAGIW